MGLGGGGARLLLRPPRRRAPLRRAVVPARVPPALLRSHVWHAHTTCSHDDGTGGRMRRYVEAVVGVCAKQHVKSPFMYPQTFASAWASRVGLQNRHVSGRHKTLLGGRP